MATISLPTIKKDTKSLIEEKLLELKKLHFFSISEKIRKGLKRNKVKLEDILGKWKRNEK